MRLKYYLRGAGVGVIVATLVLMISFATMGKKSLSDEEIITRARELGMVYENELSNDSAQETSKDDNIEEKNDNEEEKESSSVDYSKEQIQDAQTETDLEKDDEAEDVVVNYIAFTVQSGQTSNQISANLFKAGLVDDADAFSKYLDKLGVDDKLQPGTFYISDNSSYDDIVALLVTKQDERSTSRSE